MQMDQSSYEKDEGAQGYLNSLDSENGKIFKDILSKAILKRLAGASKFAILDAGCGSGWLTKILADQGHRVKACDISPKLIEKAKRSFPNLDFQVADLTQALPYQNQEFDSAILCLTALDLKNQKAAFTEISRVLKPGGILIIATVNPYYGFPVGVWKRGLIGRLLIKKPALKLRPYFDFARKTDRAFSWNENLVSYFYTLPEQINTLTGVGFTLKHLADVESKNDDDKYSLKYRLYRFPIFIIMEFGKN